MIDYDQDIAPLSQTYFPALMGAQDFDRAMAFRQEKLLPMRQQTMSMVDDQRKRESALLNYQSAQLALEAQKKSIENQQMYKDLEPEIFNKVDSIMDDPTLTDSAKREGIFEVERDYIGAITNSPAIDNYFKSVDNQFTKRSADAAKAKASDSSLRNSLANTYFNSTANQGNFNSEVYIGIKEGMIPAGEASDLINSLVKKSKEGEARLKSAEESETNARSYFEDLKKYAEAVTFKAGKGGGVVDTDSSGNLVLPDGSDSGEPPKFAKAKDRKIVTDQLLTFRPDLKETVEDMGDMELRDNLLDALNIIGKSRGFLPTLPSAMPESEEEDTIKNLTGTN